MKYQKHFLRDCARRTPIGEPAWQILLGALAMVLFFLLMAFTGA